MMNYRNIRQTFPDPYDVWTGQFAVGVREDFYAGKLSGKVLAAIITGVDWLAPTLLRTRLKSIQRQYPISTAQLILMNETISAEDGIDALLNCATDKIDQFGLSWGLGFPWMSKNGLYSPDMPFVTHTPYAMEALVALSEREQRETKGTRALDHFCRTWRFLESLEVMHESPDTLALSYAPLYEPRIVVNANAYAAFAHLLHAEHNKAVADTARGKALRIIRFVIDAQNQDGSWHYYADSLPGNFIDCFHTCFVIKNLVKAGTCDQSVKPLCEQAINRGVAFLKDQFFNQKSGLVKRFAERDIKDPYRWDIYDQAEYLGVLIDTGDLEAATNLARRTEDMFFDGQHWYCRIDMLGRRWGKDFGRWGIVPFLHQTHRLSQLQQNLGNH